MAKRYKILKESPELRRGDILIEDIIGDKYRLDKNTKEKYPDKMGEMVVYTRATVEKQPSWFEEIVSLDVPKKHYIKAKVLISKLK